MRYSKDHKAQTHERIVESASVRLRERGAAGVGVAELMKDAGLTHGGFYAHFASRDALIGEAFAYAMEQTTKRWRRRAEQAPEGKRFAAIVNGYLTQEHRDDIGNGCALPSLGAEVLRASPKTRKAFTAKLEEMICVVADQVSEPSPAAARRDAIATLATMMGALILARSAGAGDLSDEILSVGRDTVLQNERPAKPRVRRTAKASKAA